MILIVCVSKDTSVVTTSDSDCVCQRTRQWSLRVFYCVKSVIIVVDFH